MKGNWKKDFKIYGVVLVLFGVYCVIAERIFGQLCPTMITVGLPCPGCGMTRASLLLLAGDLAGSFYMHPLLIPLILGVAFLGWMKYVKGIQTDKFKTAYLIALIIMFVVYVVRMVYLFPHTAPMEINENAIIFILHSS